MDSKNVSRAIEELAQRFAQESIGAIDHGVNARAIALMDAKLRSNLEERLARGYTLVRVAPRSGYGSQTDNFVIGFEFRKPSADKLVDLDTTFLRVSVNLPARAVVRIEEVTHSPFEADDVPFAVAVPSRAGEAVTLSELLTGTRQRERDFMRGLGLTDLVRTRDGDGWLQSSNNTFVDTSTGTTERTEYDSPVNSGYTADSVTDIKQDPGGDTDNKIDGSNDPERDGLLVLPTDRPILVLPRPRPGPSPKPTPGPDPVGPEGAKR
jgi:hypothetical protein